MNDLSPRPLAATGCRRACAWAATGDTLAGEPLFSCAGCGSEWVRSQEWTPVDWQGVVPAAVLAERARG